MNGDFESSAAGVAIEFSRQQLKARDEYEAHILDLWGKDRVRLAEAERLLRGWVGTANMVKDLTFAPVAHATMKFIAPDSASAWPGPYGLCPDGTPHLPKDSGCIKCGHTVTVSAPLEGK